MPPVAAQGCAGSPLAQGTVQAGLDTIEYRQEIALTVRILMTGDAPVQQASFTVEPADLGNQGRAMLSLDRAPLAADLKPQGQSATLATPWAIGPAWVFERLH